MDATAQAELVRSGEASPVELVEEAIARVEELNPQVNAVIHELFEQGRAEAAAADLPDGPVQGRPVPVQGPRRRARRPAASPGDEAAQGSELPRPGRHHPGAALPRRRLRRRSARPTCPSSASCRRPSPRPTARRRNPWNLERTAGGSSGGSGGGGRLGHGRRSRTPTTAAARSGSRPRSTGCVGLKPTRQRISRGAAGRRQHDRADRRARAHPLGARHRGDPRRGPRRRRRAIPTSRPRPSARTSRSSTPTATLRIGYAKHPPVPGLQSRPRVRRRGRKRRGAARVARPRGRRVVAGGPRPWPRRSNLEDSFMTRWAAGQAAQPRPVLAAARPRADRRRRRAAHLGAGRGRPGALERAVPARPRPPPDASPARSPRWYEAGFDLLLTPTMAEPPAAAGHLRPVGRDPLDAFRRAVPAGCVHGDLQRHRPARDLAAAALDR